jgi:hypothetical protein
MPSLELRIWELHTAGRFAALYLLHDVQTATTSSQTGRIQEIRAEREAENHTPGCTLGAMDQCSSGAGLAY